MRPPPLYPLLLVAAFAADAHAQPAPSSDPRATALAAAIQSHYAVLKLWQAHVWEETRPAGQSGSGSYTVSAQLLTVTPTSTLLVNANGISSSICTFQSGFFFLCGAPGYAAFHFDLLPPTPLFRDQTVLVAIPVHDTGLSKVLLVVDPTTLEVKRAISTLHGMQTTREFSDVVTHP